MAEPAQGLDGGREVLDAYWTPSVCARACVTAIAGELRHAPTTLLEPAVGGGAWLPPAQSTWPHCRTIALDIDPMAPGLGLAERSHVGSFLAWREGVDLILGNPPYGGDLRPWLDLSLSLAPTVAYLLRGTILGSIERMNWWREHPPSVVWTLVPRPAWHGPGARRETDTVDSVLVLWRAGRTDTRLRWLGWR